jgi:hypothetical protein
MKSSSFMDEDWTGLTKDNIRRQIVAELEEQQCMEEGHKWVSAFHCRNCELQSYEALADMKEVENKEKEMRLHL